MNYIEENILTLKRFMGLTEDYALSLLNNNILITAEESEEVNHLKIFLVEMLSKTFKNVFVSLPTLEPDVEIVIGNVPEKCSLNTKIYVTWNDEELIISLGPGNKREGNLAPIFLKLGAAYLCGAVIVQVMPEKRLGKGEKYPLVINYKKLFNHDIEFINSEINLGEVYLVGMGATGTWLMEGLSLLNVSGKIHLFDDDIVSNGNLQRTPYRPDQVGLKKVFAYQQLFLPVSDRLEIIPHATRFPSEGEVQFYEKVITCVDSRVARRKIQNYMPRFTYDCSTTDISEVTLFFGSLLENDACLSCLYYEAESEEGRLLDIASSLGVSVEEVKSERISIEAAKIIQQNYPDVLQDQIIGIAYDTFVKELCGQGKLMSSRNNSVADDTLAPLCHISAIAGIFLAIEISKRHSASAQTREWNHWKINPWSSPIQKRQQILPQNENCQFHNGFGPIAVAAWKKHDQNRKLELKRDKYFPKDHQSEIWMQQEN